MGNRFIREVRTVCGQNYMEVDLFPISEREKASTRRAKRSQVSSLVQQNLNGKHAKRYFVQLVNANFNEHDLHVTLTYDDEHLPATLQQAEKDRDDFLRRLQYWGRKSGIKVKYIAVMEYREGTETEKAVRVHHHVLLDGRLGRDFVESQWTRNKEKLGYANADRLQLDKASLERLARYLLKYANRKRRWKQSRGLKKPERKQPNDSRWTARRIEKLARTGEVYDMDFWARKYPGWDMNDARPQYNEMTGEWSILVKMRRRGWDRPCRGKVCESSPIG